ncbi:MAG: autotransporter outer membrane beta-barrel domain-containing protein [Planctomycetes bacterium]|nr:autotransporter outer membrane beta-barrel domain-containing protein [Planctomycetota bacterium]
MKEIVAFAVVAMGLFLATAASPVVAAESDPDRAAVVDATTAGGLDRASLKAVQNKLRAETLVINGTIGLDGVHHFFGAGPLGRDDDTATRYWTASSSLRARPSGGGIVADPLTDDGGDTELVACIEPEPSGFYDTIALASLPVPANNEHMVLNIAGTVFTTLGGRVDDQASACTDLPATTDHSHAPTSGTTEFSATAAGTVSNVIQVGMRASHDAADMAFDRAIGYGSVLADIAAVTGADPGQAADILNATALNRFRAGGIGRWDSAEASAAAPGYRYDGRGITVGYDRAVRNVIFGAAYSYTTGDYEEKAATSHDATIDSHAITLYASYRHRSGLIGAVVAGYTFSNNDIRHLQDGEWRERDFSTRTWHVNGKIGYEFSPAENFTITPTAGIGFIDARSSAHDGFRGGNFDQRLGRMTANTAYLPVELRAAYKRRLGPDHEMGFSVKGGYTYSFAAGAAHVDVFTHSPAGAVHSAVAGRDGGHGAYRAGVGVWYRYRSLDVGINYDHTGRSESKSHRVSITAFLKF